jgi:hypothetical protein
MYLVILTTKPRKGFERYYLLLKLKSHGNTREIMTESNKPFYPRETTFTGM